MARTKLPYPPCVVNPTTEKPYTRHKWTIQGVRSVARAGEEIVVYHSVCARCGIRDPQPPLH